MSRRFFAIPLFLAAFNGFMIAPSAHANDFTAHFIFANPRMLVPSFVFEDDKGQELTLDNFKGRYVLLNIWATWCGPCAKEMPMLDALAQKLGTDSTPHPQGVTSISAPATLKIGTAPFQPRMDVVAVSEDRDGRDVAEAFYKRHDLHHLPVFVDEAGRAPSVLQIRGLPTTLLIDPNGLEIGRIEGDADWSAPETIAFLEKQMQGGNTDKPAPKK